jgi:hypothetical protein
MFSCTSRDHDNLDANVSRMRLLIAILGLLLCLVATKADEQTLIKDSEATHYVGRYVEVRGFVVSVTTSPLGTAFINYGREYPNQTFPGFVSTDSKIAIDQRIATLQGKSSESSARLSFIKGSRRSKSRRYIRS